MADPATTDQSAAWWEERYSSGATQWSGNVNDLLAPEVESLAPSRALELGCGTGGDAIWLARRGWQVMAVDIAQAALDQAAGHAAEAGVGERITWERHDLEDSFPAGAFDLVTACYLQSPVAFQRLAALRLAAAAVAPGGRLVVVSHELTPGGSGHHPATYMPTAPQLSEDLGLADDGWEIVKAEPVERSKERAGETFTYRDNVLHSQRK